MSLPTAYKNVNVYINTSIAASATTSALIDFGGVRLRTIVLPANWTTCNISFTTPLPTSSHIQSNSQANTLYYTDAGYNSTELLILNAVASTSIQLIPYHFDSLCYLYLNTSAAQSSAVTVQLICTPIYQGIHG